MRIRRLFCREKVEGEHGDETRLFFGKEDLKDFKEGFIFNLRENSVLKSKEIKIIRYRGGLTIFFIFNINE